MIKKVTFQKYNDVVGMKFTLLDLAIKQTTVNLPLSDKMIWEKIYILLAKLLKEISCLWGQTSLLYIKILGKYIYNK